MVCCSSYEYALFANVPLWDIKGVKLKVLNSANKSTFSTQWYVGETRVKRSAIIFTQ